MMGSEVSAAGRGVRFGAGRLAAVVGAACAAAFGVGGGVAYFAMGSLAEAGLEGLVESAPPQPVVAVLNLSRVLGSLNQAEASARDLEAFDASLKARVETMVKELEALGQDIEMLPAGAPERRQAEQRFRELRVRIEVEQNIRKARVDEEYVGNLGRIFESIRTATTEVSQRNGYTLVLYDESSAELPPARAGVDLIRGAINQRRVAYVDPKHDITQEVIDYMNNQFARTPTPR